MFGGGRGRVEQCMKYKVGETISHCIYLFVYRRQRELQKKMKLQRKCHIDVLSQKPWATI